MIFILFLLHSALVDKAARDQTSVSGGFEESDSLDSPFLPWILSLQLHPGEKNVHNKLNKKGRSGVNQWAVD